MFCTFVQHLFMTHSIVNINYERCHILGDQVLLHQMQASRTTSSDLLLTSIYSTQWTSSSWLPSHPGLYHFKILWLRMINLVFTSYLAIYIQVLVMKNRARDTWSSSSLLVSLLGLNLLWDGLKNTTIIHTANQLLGDETLPIFQQQVGDKPLQFFGRPVFSRHGILVRNLF